MPNYYFIVNPTSGRGKGKAFGSQLQQKLNGLQLDYQLEYTTKPMHAQDLAAKASDKFEVIVVVGGDGTLQEALNGMVGSDAALGILPVGSGNDFVRAVPIPTDMDKSLKILLNPTKGLYISKTVQTKVSP